MSKDPFQELFDREIPRSAPPAATRATLNELTPQFQRARSRRRARVGAVAVIAVFGATGGAAAIGIVGPIGDRNEVPVDFAGFASATAVDNLPELAPLEAVDESVVIEPAETAEVPAHMETDDSANPNDDSPDPTGTDPGPSGTDTGPPSVDESGASVSPDDDKSDSDDDSDHDDDESHHDSENSTPVAGPLTRSIDEGTVTVDSLGNTLVIVDVVPAPGVDYTVKNDVKDPAEIEIRFVDIANGERLSSLKFKLVEGGITYKVER